MLSNQSTSYHSAAQFLFSRGSYLQAACRVHVMQSELPNLEKSPTSLGLCLKFRNGSMNPFFSQIHAGIQGSSIFKNSPTSLRKGFYCLRLKKIQIFANLSKLLNYCYGLQSLGVVPDCLFQKRNSKFLEKVLMLPSRWCGLRTRMCTVYEMTA